MNEASVKGVVGSVTLGLKLDTNNLDITTTGTLKVALTDQIVGVTATGDVDVSVSWWVFVKDFKAKGELFLGSYKKHNGEWQFAVYAASSSENGSNMTPVCWPSDALNTVSL